MILGFDALGRVALGGTVSAATAYSLECDAASFVFTGNDAGDPLLPGTLSQLTLVGGAALFAVNTPADFASFAFAGEAVVTLYGQKIDGEAGLFLLQGEDAMPGVARRTFGEAGEFACDGKAIGKGLIVSFANRLTRGGSYSDQITTGPSLIT